MAKTYNHLYKQITSFENLYQAAKKAEKGKRFQRNVAHFNLSLEDQLFRLQKELQAQTYVPGEYTTFYVFDPKKRMISAAPYRDRVVHHALCNVIEPIFERSFIYDSYANRKSKGTHKAIERYQHFAKKFPYVLKCDIKKYFPSIDHQILKETLRWRVTCTKTLWLADTIIDGSNAQEEQLVYFPQDDLFTPYQRKRGLPIGNLTSQFFANLYLAQFDHFVKHTLKVAGYIRYVDDFVLFHESKEQLHTWNEQLHHYLNRLRLRIHPNKNHIYKVTEGVPFLGFKVFPNARTVKKQNWKRCRRKMRKKVDLYQNKLLSAEGLEAGINSWLGHAQFGKAYHFQNQLISDIRKQGVLLLESPRSSWRVLEQQQQ